jgi:hypothetical protein
MSVRYYNDDDKDTFRYEQVNEINSYYDERFITEHEDVKLKRLLKW